MDQSNIRGINLDLKLFISCYTLRDIPTLFGALLLPFDNDMGLQPHAGYIASSGQLPIALEVISEIMEKARNS